MRELTYLTRTAVISLLLLVGGASAQSALSSKQFSESFVIKAINTIVSAEFTYSATDGLGSYAALSDLPYIDNALASGTKYGYRFVITVTPRSNDAPSRFELAAVPVSYRKTGIRSFFIDTSNELHGADKYGEQANADDPYIDQCSLFGARDNERCTAEEMHGIFSAEMTYAATTGSSQFGGLSELRNASLINSQLGTGTIHGYEFTVTTSPGYFRITAVPTTYNVTGKLSFYIDNAGVLHAADKKGLAADEHDPVI